MRGSQNKATSKLTKGASDRDFKTFCTAKKAGFAEARRSLKISGEGHEMQEEQGESMRTPRSERKKEKISSNKATSFMQKPTPNHKLTQKKPASNPPSSSTSPIAVSAQKKAKKVNVTASKIPRSKKAYDTHALQDEYTTPVKRPRTNESDAVLSAKKFFAETSDDSPSRKTDIDPE